jgi:hypothetical protein
MGIDALSKAFSRAGINESDNRVESRSFVTTDIGTTDDLALNWKSKPPAKR